MNIVNLVKKVDAVASICPQSITNGTRNFLRKRGVSDEVIHEAVNRGILRLLSGDAHWNLEHLARAGVPDREAKMLALRPVVFAAESDSALASYAIRKTDERGVFCSSKRNSLPIVWHGDVPYTAVVETPMQLLAIVSMGFKGHVIALPAGEWMPWWGSKKIVTNVRHVVVIERMTVLAGTPFEAMQEHFPVAA